MVFGFGWYSFGDHLFSTTSTEQRDSHLCASAGIPKGSRACDLFGGWDIGGKIAANLMSTEPNHLNN
ncbi:Uncharacterised protein [Yersinia frederiksenii]|nr:Uncharacterised protein [Yersinia frederiksenii]